MFIKYCYSCIVFVVLCLFPLWVFTQDTIRKEHLNEIRVVEKAAPSTVRSQTPVQVIRVEKLEQVNAVQLSDAIKQLTGVAIRDYGGIGGIKTISARGLGSQFSHLSIDGITITDCQNGQIDLGRFLTGDVDHISFANGQLDDIFQTARAFSSGNVINLQTKCPVFYEKSTNIKMGIEKGSFGLWHPSFYLAQRITKKLSISTFADYMLSKGDYPFTLYYTTGRNDSISKERRQNSDIRIFTGSLNLFYTLSSKQQIKAKIHYYNSYRGLPGPVTLYSVKTSERSFDNVFFTQLNYLNLVSEKLKFQINGKYYRSECIYEDTASLTPQGFTHNEYLQNEYYLSGSIQYQMMKHLKVNYSTDLSIHTLHSNLAANNEATRNSWLNVIAGYFEYKRINISANILATSIRETVCSSFKKDYTRFSPYVGASFLLLKNKNLRLRYFFKENYRVPSFNEMYYSAIERDLKPEKALQNNLGLSYINSIENSWVEYIIGTVDGYYNRVTDKIVAIPAQSLFLWSMINIGRVDIWGLDVKVDASFSIISKFTLSAAVFYSLQSALDKTDAASKTYNQQIPYTPLHSGGGSLYLENPYVDFGYNISWVGNRYKLAQNTENNLVQGYVEQGILIAKKFKFKFGEFKLQAQVLNLFNVQYEVIKNYPMMGRNYKCSITYLF